MRLSTRRLAQDLEDQALVILQLKQDTEAELEATAAAMAEVQADYERKKTEARHAFSDYVMACTSVHCSGHHCQAFVGSKRVRSWARSVHGAGLQLLSTTAIAASAADSASFSC